MYGIFTTKAQSLESNIWWKKKKAILIAWQHHVEFLELFLSLFKEKTLTPPTYPNLPIKDSTQRWWWPGISLGATFIQQNTPEYILALRQIMSFNYVKKALSRKHFNVVSSWFHLWNMVETTLNGVAATVFQVWTTLFQFCFNIDIILPPRCFNVASTLVEVISKPIWLVISMDLQIYWYLLR